MPRSAIWSTIGLPLAEAAWRLSTLPADWLGLTDIGRLTPGARADLVVADEQLLPTRVVIGGRDVHDEEPQSWK